MFEVHQEELHNAKLEEIKEDYAHEEETPQLQILKEEAMSFMLPAEGTIEPD